MVDSDRALGERIAERVAELRAGRGLSLDALATESGVSRSMISLIERSETSPTAVVLDKLARALGVALASLFDPAEADVAEPVARRDDQPCWRDPESGYRRRNVSPPGFPRAARIVDVHFPAGARVAFDNGGRDDAVQQVWVLQGAIDVQVGEVSHALREGDCLAMRLDAPTVFHNPRRTAARYAVVIATDPVGRRP